MKIPIPIMCVFLSALVALNAWTLSTVVGLKTDVAAIKAELKSVGPVTQISSLNK